MKLLIHSKHQRLHRGNLGMDVISTHIFLGMWLLIHAGIRLIHVTKWAPELCNTTMNSPMALLLLPISVSMISAKRHENRKEEGDQYVRMKNLTPYLTSRGKVSNLFMTMWLVICHCSLVSNLSKQWVFFVFVLQVNCKRRNNLLCKR